MWWHFSVLAAAGFTLAATTLNASARPFEQECGRGAGLGVARTEVIDTTGGPRFGLQFQNDGTSFLAPGEIVLSFDDGPFAATTKPILNTLDRFCAKATFFVVGRMAVVQPNTLREIARRGHTIAGHTWAHANLGNLSEENRVAEVEKGFSALTELLGAPVAPFFRFPYLRAPDSELTRLSARNVAVFGIDVDSTDSHGQNVPAKRIIERTLSALEKTGKGIILLHDLKPATAAALPELLAALTEKGYRLVHLVAKRNFEPNAAFTAEVAEVILKRQKKLDGMATKTVAVAGTAAASPGTRPVRHIGKTKAVGRRTSTTKKDHRKGRDKPGTAEQTVNGPFTRS